MTKAVTGLSADVKQYLVVTGNYWAFTLTDGALRMLVVLHFHQLNKHLVTIQKLQTSLSTTSFGNSEARQLQKRILCLICIYVKFGANCSVNNYLFFWSNYDCYTYMTQWSSQNITDHSTKYETLPLNILLGPPPPQGQEQVGGMFAKWVASHY